jgi:predicted PurR-regulated permease PerM
MNYDVAPTPPPDSFRRQLTIATYALLFVVLVIHLLEKFASILQPLLIAVFVLYVLYPIHSWLVRRGVRPMLAHILILAGFIGGFTAVGQAVYQSAMSITPERLDAYRVRFESLINHTAETMGYHGEEPATSKLRKALGSQGYSGQDLFGAIRNVAGSFRDTLTFFLIVFVYIVFLMAERVSFAKRLSLAFGDARATHIQMVVGSINEAIAQYIAVKGWISFITGAMSLAVFAAFGIDFAVLWGALIFLLNFIPYIGGLVAMGPPILLAFLQLSPVEAIVVVALLIGIQVFTGQYLEPKMAGRKLNLSPLLILLALAFWAYLWSIVGMILAVPLTVVCKIVLDNITETKPVGTLMSNV